MSIKLIKTLCLGLCVLIPVQQAFSSQGPISPLTKRLWALSAVGFVGFTEYLTYCKGVRDGAESKRSDDLRRVFVIKSKEIPLMLPLFDVFFQVAVTVVTSLVVGYLVKKFSEQPVKDALPDNKQLLVETDSVVGEIPEKIKEFLFLATNKELTKKHNMVPKGLIMYGPPGTGKTLLAAKVAQEIGAPFIAVSGADFDSMYRGGSKDMIRATFKTARDLAKQSPTKIAVLFVDEIDGLGKRIAADSLNASLVVEKIATFLDEIDGISQKGDQDGRVIVIGATNRLQDIDPALKRPGRMDYLVEIPLPNEQSRHAILDYYFKKSDIDYDPMIIDSLAQVTAGFNCATLKSLVDKVVLAALMKASKQVGDENEHILITLQDCVPVLQSIAVEQLQAMDQQQLMELFSSTNAASATSA